MNEAIYCRNLEAVVLLDGKDIDITEIKDEFKRDCLKLCVGYVATVLICVGLLFVFVICSDGFFSGESAFEDAAFTIIDLCIVAYAGYSLYRLYRARYKAAFQGIHGTCDNIMHVTSKGGMYYNYHCTTELGEHGIAHVSGKARASVGDDILYIRVFNHDLIYRVGEYTDNQIF